MSTNRLLTFAAAAAIVGILAIGWFLGVAPNLASIAQAEIGLLGAKQANAAQQAQLQNLQTRFSAIDTERASSKALDAAIPTAADVEDFADTVQTRAAQYGLSLQNLTFAEGTAYGTTSASASAPAPAPATSSTSTAGGSATPAASGTAAATATTGLVTIPVTISVNGDPDQAMRFVDALQRGDRVFLVTSVTTTNGDSASSSIQGDVFVLLGSGSTTAATAKN